MADTPKKRPRTVVVLNETNLRRIKIRIDGYDGAKGNGSRSICVLAESIDVVRDRILESLRGGEVDG